MKKQFLSLAAIAMGTLLFAETGYDIMKKADEVLEPKTSSSTATLTIHSKKGSDRIREVIMKSKDYGDVEKQIIVFTTPKDVAGTGYLMFDYDDDDKDSDSWLYMPAMKKTRRIASSGSESDGSFMGTDFTYRDMGDRSLNKYDYTLLGEESVDGVDCYKVECVSKDRSEKDPRYISYIGKGDYILRKCDFNLHGLYYNQRLYDSPKNEDGKRSVRHMVAHRKQEYSLRRARHRRLIVHRRRAGKRKG